jgi:4-amino-4-deoxy-L-arabinose transferase-like glycosyltransferase
MKQKQIHIILIILSLILLSILIRGLNIDVTRDAAKYAYIAKEIVQNNQWIDLQIDNEPYEQKPHLTFWLSAISFLIFGVSNFAFKLPLLVYSLMGLFFTYKLGQSAYNKKTGFLAATISSFSVVFILYNQDIHTDTVLFTNTAFALWQLWEYLRNTKTRNLLGSAFALGLCMLTKGPFGIVLPVLSVLSYILATKQIKRIFHFSWLLIALGTILISAPVFYQLYINWGIEGYKFFFITNTFGRFTGSYLGQNPDPTFYIHNILYLFLPWTVLFFVALYKGIVQIKNKSSKAPDFFFLFGFLLFFIIISVSQSKLPNYIMAVLPTMAIITAVYWEQFGKTTTSINKIQNTLNILLMITVSAISFFFNNNLYFVKLLVLLLATAVFIFASRKIDKNYKTIINSMGALIVAGLCLNFNIVPELFGHQAQPKAAQYLNSLQNNQAAIYNYPKEELKLLRHLWDGVSPVDKEKFDQTPPRKHFSLNYALKFYSNRHVKHIQTPKELAHALDQTNAWFFTDHEGMLEISNSNTNIDTIINYQHFSLRHSARYLFPKKNENTFDRQYLIHITKENMQ